VSSMGSARQHRTAIRLWFENIGSTCAYCGVEMIPYEKAFVLNRRVQQLDKYTKAERRRAPNHPTVDHIVPSSQGGSSKMKNYAICCEQCNHDKSDMSYNGMDHSLRKRWFRVIDQYIRGNDGEPYPDPPIKQPRIAKDKQ